MALYVANAPAISPTISVPATASRSFMGALLLRPAGFVKNAAQGAGAGLLTLLGSMHLAEGAGQAGGAAGAPIAGLPSSLQAIAENLLGGSAPGAAEIIAAAALFLHAGAGMARIIGLLGFVMVAVAYANGATPADFTAQMTSLVGQFKGLVPALLAVARG